MDGRQMALGRSDGAALRMTDAVVAGKVLERGLNCCPSLNCSQLQAQRAERLGCE